VTRALFVLNAHRPCKLEHIDSHIDMHADPRLQRPQEHSTLLQDSRYSH